MNIPTEGELYAKLIDHLRSAQSDTATLSHLTGLNGGAIRSRGWLAISEQLRMMQNAVIAIASGKIK